MRASVQQTRTDTSHIRPFSTRKAPSLRPVGARPSRGCTGWGPAPRDGALGLVYQHPFVHGIVRLPSGLNPSQFTLWQPFAPASSWPAPPWPIPPACSGRVPGFGAFGSCPLLEADRRGVPQGIAWHTGVHASVHLRVTQGPQHGLLHHRSGRQESARRICSLGADRRRGSSKG
jgi:hypothetical protein